MAPSFGPGRCGCVPPKWGCGGSPSPCLLHRGKTHRRSPSATFSLDLRAEAYCTGGPTMLLIRQPGPISPTSVRSASSSLVSTHRGGWNATASPCLGIGGGTSSFSSAPTTVWATDHLPSASHRSPLLPSPLDHRWPGTSVESERNLSMSSLRKRKEWRPT